MKFVLRFVWADIEFLRDNLYKMTNKKVWARKYIEALSEKQCKKTKIKEIQTRKCMDKQNVIW